MKTMKRALAVLLAAVLLCVGVPLAANAEEGLAPTGSCGDNVTWSFDAETGALTISGTGRMDDYDYFSGSDSPFCSNRDIKSVAINGDVTSIGDYAFWGCNALTSMSIPNSVTSIGSHAFSYCTALPCMEIPDRVAYIGDCAFYSCRSLTYIYVSENNPKYASDDYGCLYNKSKTTLIQYPVGNSRTLFTIPNSVTSIGCASFRECISLTSVTIPDSVTSICGEAFNYCLSLTSVMIPDSVTSIGIGAFFGCYALASLTLGNGVTSIGDAAFNRCESLISVTIPDSVTSIGESAFCGCISLTRFYIPEANSAYATDDSGCLYNKNKTCLIQYPSGNTRTRFYIPDSVTSIGQSAFWCSDALTSVTISENVTSIGAWAFYACISLQNVMIPDSVTSIGDWVFNTCRSLTDVYYSGSEEEWEAVTIGSENYPIKTATIHFNYYHEHEPGVSVHENVIPATCSQEGSYTEVIYCVDCAKELSRETIYEGVPNPDAHNPGEPARENEQPATCKTAASYESVTYCTLCGEELSRETIYEGEPDPNAHDPQIGPYVPATCTEDGYAPFICTRCGKTVAKTDPDPALGHDPKPVYTWAKDDSTVTAEMTCTRCGDVAFEETAKVTTEITVKPTCSTEGELTLIAAFNNKAFYAQTKTRVLPTDPDAHVFKVTVTPPTCVDDGYTTHACTLCRYGYADEITPALDHDWDDGEVTLAPTCTTTGTMLYTCKREGCGATFEKKLDADPNAHVLETVVHAPTCTEDGCTAHLCKNCKYGYTDAHVDALGHDYADAKATGNGDGTHTLTCNRCKQPGEAISCTDADNDGKCDYCGEQMQGGDHCKFCGKVHDGGFFDKLTGFFHKIFAIFKR